MLCDLVNEANVGLLKSIKTYDSKFENKFYTYAVHWMRKEICDYLTYFEPTIKKSNKNKSSSKVKKLSNDFLNLLLFLKKLFFLAKKYSSALPGQIV